MNWRIEEDEALSAEITQLMKEFLTEEVRKTIYERDGDFLGYVLQFPDNLQKLINRYKMIWMNPSR